MCRPSKNVSGVEQVGATQARTFSSYNSSRDGIGFLNWIFSRLIGFVDYGSIILAFIAGLFQLKYFSQGYGNATTYREQANMEYERIQKKHQHTTNKPLLSDRDIDWSPVKTQGSVTLQEGRFVSPVAKHLPEESKYAHFELVKPKDTAKFKQNKPVYVIMLPATGETDGFLRQKMAQHLANQYGWSSVIVTAPYYGERQPQNQRLTFLNTVKDILVQGDGVIQEAAYIASYFHQPNTAASTYGHICFTGFSFGGAMAACAAAFALHCVGGHFQDGYLACASYAGSASPCCFADGVLARAIDWTALPVANKSALATNVDAVERELRRQALFDELQQTQLEIIRPTTTIKAKPGGVLVKAIAMRHDAFLTNVYSREFERQIQTTLVSKDTSFELQWRSGGHAWAALLRPILHTKLVEDTVEELLRQTK